MTAYIIPALILLLFLYAKIKKVDCFSTFVEGSKKSLKLVTNIFPYICAILIAVALLRESGITGFIVEKSSPLFSALGMPSEVLELVFMRPLSGSGSIAILKNIIAEYGADSFISRCASTIMGSSETVFYVATVYFSKTSVKKLSYALPVALLTTFLSAILACLFCTIM